VNGKKTVKGLVLMLLFAIVSSLAFPAGSSAKSRDDTIKEEYKKYVAKKQKKKGRNLYYAIIKASKNKTPVLLISDEIMSSDSNTNLGSKKGSAVKAKVYSYSKGKVKFITKMTSTGASYPLLRKGKYILSGWHHASQRLVVNGGKGILEEVSGFYLSEDFPCYKKKWIVTNGKRKKINSKKISQKKATSLDYYHYEIGKEIEFCFYQK